MPPVKKKYHSSFLFYDIFQIRGVFFIEGISDKEFTSAMECRQYIAFEAPPRDKKLLIALQLWNPN